MDNTLLDKLIRCLKLDYLLINMIIPYNYLFISSLTL